MDIRSAAGTPVSKVLTELTTSAEGLSAEEAAARLAHVGPNAVRAHRVAAPAVLLRQVRSPLLVLLAAAALASFFLGERPDAVIIGVILVLSIGLGFVNEYRAEKASAALRSQIRHEATVLRSGEAAAVDVASLVPGDMVLLQPGQVVPADLRLVDATNLECDEAVLTGEAVSAEKTAEATTGADAALAELRSCALMGTIVRAGSGRGVVVATGPRTEFGSIATGLDEREPETEFQAGLRHFSLLLVRVAGVLASGVVVLNVALHRPIIDALLFSLAIAVGITPQLLPAVVSTSLAVGTRQLARRKVLVKRLVCIEDLGDVDVLFTDKTGTLTEGHIRFMRSASAAGVLSDSPVLNGLLASDVAGGGAVANPLDSALWSSPAATHAAKAANRYQRVAMLPFDHDRRLLTVLADEPDGGRILVTKGAPEAVLARCCHVPQAATAFLDREFAAGNRVIAVASRPAPGKQGIVAADECGFELNGFLVFLDPPKREAAHALRRLRDLGVTVKVVTGDNAVVATTVCRELHLPVHGVLSGSDIDALDDDALQRRIATATVFARVSPAHKARIVRAERRRGVDVAFLGDGVNDAVALHAADIGISVDTATDVAKDAADVILLEKNLDVLADGVLEGRRIFANTIKYVLMGTSSNFGNMFSAAGASAFLRFLPMLPSQILLNNLLYDTSQLTIPTDHVDPEQLARPSRWDLGLIKRFMLVFGPLSSVFDFATFAILLWGWHAHAALFRSGWFIESLATQALVLFVIRTRRSPFFRSLPSVPLLLAVIGVVLVGALIPLTPLAHRLGFSHVPAALYAALLGLVVTYLVLIEAAKRRFFRAALSTPQVRTRRSGHRVARRAAHLSTG